MMQILVTSADRKTRKFLHHELTAAGHTVRLWEGDVRDISPAMIQTPTVLIGDWTIRYGAEYGPLWEGMKADPSLPPLFCLMLASQDGFAQQYAIALEQGVDDLIPQPLHPEMLKARVLAAKHILNLKQELQTQKDLLDSELAEAEAYVRSLLPDDVTEKIPIQARFIPSRLLGGDCYDYYWLDPDYLVMYLLDVSGHGLGSALLSTSVLNMLRSQSLPDVNFYRPEKVLKALNDTFQMNDQNEKYFTIWYGVYNRANRQLLYASAGHPPAVLVSNQDAAHQTVECLRTSGLPVGMLSDVQYQWQRCYIPPTSRLYLFSDGVYEIKQTDDTIMGLDEFIEILAQQTRDLTIDDLLEKVNSRTQSRAFADDLSLLEIQLD